jgi:hypothetical protein
MESWEGKANVSETHILKTAKATRVGSVRDRRPLPMNDLLATYLHDRRAGAVVAINLLEALRDQHGGEPLGQFAAELLVEVEADRAVLQGLAEQVGKGSSRLKEATALLGEKVSRLKLRRWSTRRRDYIRRAGCI